MVGKADDLTIAVPFRFLCVSGSVSAAEHVGLVRSNELPIPGTSVIATQDETTRVTSTDQTGRYRFDRMQPGVWTLEVSMFGFESVTREIEITDGASPTEWELTLAARQQQAAPGDGEQLSRAERRERFQRLLVNESQQNSIMNELAAMPDPTISMASEQDANESFLVTGSLSRGLQRRGATVSSTCGRWVLAAPRNKGILLPIAAATTRMEDRDLVAAAEAPAVGGSAARAADVVDAEVLAAEERAAADRVAPAAADPVVLAGRAEVR